MNLKERLLYEYERLDLEYAVLNTLKRELLDVGKEYAAGDVEKAVRYLQKAISCVKQSWIFLEND